MDVNAKLFYDIRSFKPNMADERFIGWIEFNCINYNATNCNECKPFNVINFRASELN